MVVAGTLGYHYIRGNHWAVGFIETFAAGDTGIEIRDMPAEIVGYGRDLIVDGITVLGMRAGGGMVITPFLRTGHGTITAYLSTFTTTNTVESRSYSALDFPITIDGEVWLGVGFSTALADTIEAEVWGHFNKVDTTGPQLQSVSLEGYKWPLQRRY